MSDKKDIEKESGSANEELQKRRKALKNILAGSGTVVTAAAMKDKWARPVVESVVLPAHAQTSGRVYSGSGLTTTFISDEDGSLLADLTESLVQEAQAQAEGDFYSCATDNGSTADVVIAGESHNEYLEMPGVLLVRRGTLTIPTGAGPGPWSIITAAGGDVSPCYPGGDDIDVYNRQARINSINDENIVIQVLTHCEEHSGLGNCNQGLILTVMRSDVGCLPEPFPSDVCSTTYNPGATPA